jgi:hypothetical protein
MPLRPLLVTLSLLLVVPFIGVAQTGKSGAGLQQMVDAAVAAGEAVIRIPPGRYEVKPVRGKHLTLKGLRNVTIDARGVELVCTETTLAIHVQDCDNLRIEGLTIDYDPLPFTQGRIVEIAADRKAHILEIMDGFPPATAAYVFKHSVYRPDGELRFGSYYQFQVEALPDGRLKVFGLSPRVDGGEQVGDIVVVSTQQLTGPYLPHAIVVSDSRGTVFEGVTIYSSPCFGFFEHDASGSVYRNCVVDRRAGRVHSLNADAFHSKHAEVGPQIIGSKAMWQGDDCVNICGDYHLVTGGEGKWLRILATPRVRIQAGDVLQVVTAAGQRLDNAVAVAVEPSGPATDADWAIVDQFNLQRKTVRRMNQAYVLRLDRPVELAPGAVVGSENRKGNGFAVIDCQFGNNRSRGILIKASNGQIRGNTLINTHMQSILIAPEYYWLESGFSHNLIIANNHITKPGREAVWIKGAGPFVGHQHLEVVDNVIQTAFAPALRIEAVNQGRVAGNQIADLAGSPLADALRVQHCLDLEFE